jgi:DNA-binding YbaB/EbfC family protein
MFNMQQMMAKAQTMQKKMEEVTARAGEIEVEGQSGGGMVKIVMTCKGEVRSVVIDPSIVVAAEKDMLEDLVKAAMNDARAKADAKMAEETQGAMSGLGLPPGFKLPF